MEGRIMTVTLNAAGGSSVPNWTLVASNAPTGVGTYTFSGLAGYSKYRILAPNLICTVGGASLQLRLNGDSGANYLFSDSRNNTAALGGGALPTAVAQLTIASIINTAPSGVMFEVDHALLAIPKFISGKAASQFGDTFDFNGFYTTTSTLTSITLLLGGNNFSTGTIYLLGAN